MGRNEEKLERMEEGREVVDRIMKGEGVKGMKKEGRTEGRNKGREKE